jgi:hypothetical protein
VRRAALVMVVFACLVGASPAGAHSRAPAVALDYRLELATEVPSGVHAEVVDGDRALRLRVDPPHRVVVRGLLGEPALRFAPDGVWANRASPTADADKLVRRGSGWERLTTSHTLLWHDHRLAPPASLRPGKSAGWSLPLVVDGRAEKLEGTFTRVARPPLWPWLAAGLVALVAVSAFARAAPRRRPATASTGDAITRSAQWIEVASAALLAVLAAAALLFGNRSLRTWTAMVVGVVASAVALGSLGVFRHGVVVSSLPAVLARLATAVALFGGAAAVVLAVLTPTNRGARR